MEKFPGLVRSLNPKTRWESIDHDYIDKLSDEEKKWLSNFNEEYLSGNFNHKGKKFHKTKKERKACYDRNNARNRCIYTRNRTNGWIADNESFYSEKSGDLNPASHEEDLLDLLETKDKIKKE